MAVSAANTTEIEFYAEGIGAKRGALGGYEANKLIALASHSQNRKTPPTPAKRLLLENLFSSVKFRVIGHIYHNVHKVNLI